MALIVLGTELHCCMLLYMCIDKADFGEVAVVHHMTMPVQLCYDWLLICTCPSVHTPVVGYDG